MVDPDRYRDLVEALSQVVYEVDQAGRFTYVNAVADEVFGISKALVERGITVSELLVPQDRERAGENIRRILRGENVGVNEYSVVGPNGRVVPVIIDSRPIIADGEVVGLRGVVIDISRQKQLDEELRAADRLASIGTLAAGLAHEINNPLTSVLGNIQVLDEVLGEVQAKLDPPTATVMRELVDAVLSGTRRVAQITRDLSILARADDGPSEAVRVDAAVDQGMAIARNQVTHSARMRREGESDLRVMGREHRLVQVFSNLLVNAAQNLPESGDDHEIVIAVRREADSVICEVRDTGPGIPESLLSTLFDPFVTGRPGVGTGMGLAICKRIVRGMGGELSARNRPEGGACFEVSLPVSQQSPVGEPARGPIDLAPVRVLVVDDDASVLSVMSRFLGDAQLDTASGGANAVERIEGADFDVVLCDLMMPGLNGRDVYRRVQEIRPDLARRFVFMTGGAFRRDMESFLRTVEVPVLSKPIDRHELRGTVLQASLVD